ncbi:hypothetical protein [Marimonas arenosa]|uniref:Uncharacterized protein n=1 Tax=Marimonas arenosa TaxID=1795305 RepID=A0AAE3WJ00_9RHOB|nr:hypothetical protein [Marimonas arenosa]MDQ2092338.1 hypothetical protein [Marimonas arenosa]
MYKIFDRSRRAVCASAAKLFLALIAWITFSSGQTMAQPVLSNDQLYSAARNAWNNRDYVRSYGYLEAYFQRNPSELQDAGFKTAMQDWYQRAYEQAKAATTTASSGSPGGSGNIGSSQHGLTYNPPDKSRHPRSYRLRCTGGGQMAVHYAPGADVHSLSVRFSRSGRAAGNGWPEPGRCAWIDRPLQGDEPYVLLWQFDPHDRSVGRVTFGAHTGAPGVNIPRNTGTGILARIMYVTDQPAGTLSRLLNAMHYGRHFEVNCYNNRRGQLVVTDVTWPGQE